MSQHRGAHHAGAGPSTMQRVTGEYPTMPLPIVCAPTGLSLSTPPESLEQVQRAQSRISDEAIAQRAQTARRLAIVAMITIPEGFLSLGLGLADLLARH